MLAIADKFGSDVFAFRKSAIRSRASVAAFVVIERRESQCIHRLQLTGAPHSVRAPSSGAICPRSCR